MNTLPRKIMTLCILRDGERVLLGLKKVRLGAGRWNGFGGKVEEGEDIEAAAKREVLEESGIEVGEIEKIGVCEFHSPVRPFVVEMHIFQSSDFSGTPIETDEMMPQWFDISNLPKDEMWKSDLYWWPYFLDGKPFNGRFVFDENDNVVEKNVRLINSLP